MVLILSLPGYKQKTYQFYEFMYFETTFLFTFAGTI